MLCRDYYLPDLALPEEKYYELVRYDRAKFRYCYEMLHGYLNADWCGILDVDMEIGVWTPIWWYDREFGEMAQTKFEEFELSEKYGRWIQCLRDHEPIIVPDVEAIKEEMPDEYILYRRLDANAVMAVPFWKGLTGFLALRNAKKYKNQTGFLRMLNYAVISSLNEYFLLETRKLTIISPRITNATDVYNGYTGTQFERPAFDDMMQDMRDGLINCIVVKDLSRLGRNYLEAGNYLEQIFPFFKVRFISITDGYDSISPDFTDEALIIPLKNIINEGYAKDISVKVSSAIATRKRQGKFMAKYPPYGYLKDPDDKNHLVIDPDTCPIVQRIFLMRSRGTAQGAIAKILNEENIPCPTRYLLQRGISKETRFAESFWDRNSVRRLLKNRVYLGMIVFGKEQSSFAKGIKRHTIPEALWQTVEGTHEPIIEKELFDTVQYMSAAGTKIFMIIPVRKRVFIRKNWIPQWKKQFVIISVCS